MAHLSADEAKQLTERIQNAGTEVVEAKVPCHPLPLSDAENSRTSTVISLTNSMIWCDNWRGSRTQAVCYKPDWLVHNAWNNGHCR